MTTPLTIVFMFLPEMTPYGVSEGKPGRACWLAFIIFEGEISRSDALKEGQDRQVL